MAGKAKEEAEIAGEKEQIQLAYTNANMNEQLSNQSIITSMQDELNEKYKNLDIHQYGKVYLVTINNKRYYTLKDGNCIEGNYIFGLYNDSGVMIYAWQELIEKNYLYVVNGELTSGYVDTNNHPSTEFVNGTLIIDENVTRIGNNGLRALSNLKEVYLPKDLEKIGSAALKECTNLKNIYVDEKNQKYSSENGVLFNKNKDKLIIYPNMNGTKYVIPNSVTTIGDSAFYGCKNLKEVTIPNSVTTLDGWWAFSMCTNLENVTIPGSIKTIEYYTFSACTNLKNINILEGVTKIQGYAFRGTSVVNLSLPDSIVSIGDYAFSNSAQLVSLKLPSNLKNLNYQSFGGDYDWTKNKLEKVTYKNVEYFNSSTLFEALQNNNVSYNATYSFYKSPFLD